MPLTALAAVLAPGVFVPSASAAAPSASTVDVVSLSQDSARLRGSVNPGGEATEYWFEYGKTTSYGSAAPLSKDGSAGSGSDDLVVSEAVHGLEPGTDYHFRVVASNASGTVEGLDGTFTTRVSSAACPNAAIREQQNSEYLPDCRAYEQVTPVEKEGQVVGLEQNRAVHLTVDPASDAVLYTSIYGLGPSNAGSRSALLATRGSSGWSNVGLFPAPGPIQWGGGIPGHDMTLLAGTPDGRMIAYWDTTTEPYGSLNVRRGDGTFVRLVDATLIGLFGNNPGQAFAMDFSPDGSRLYFTSSQRLGPAVGIPGTGDILYEWVDDGTQGSLNVVNRTNDEAVTLLSSSSASLGGQAPAIRLAAAGTRGARRNAISDGSDGHRRVFFQAPAPATDSTLTAGPVYMREDADRTIQISAPEGANPPATQLRYLDASEDGTKVFFWAGSKLTDDAAAGPGIYRYDVDPDGAGDLVFISAAATVGGEAPTAMASPDGENLLFADGDTTKVSVSGTVASVVDEVIGGGYFFSTGNDSTSTASDRGIRDDRCPTASVTPDGRFFVFSTRNGSIYRYDVATGALRNVSMPPVPAVGVEHPSVVGGVAAFVSQCATQAAPRPYKSKLVSDDGRRVFFTSLNALVAGDTSPAADAYEWFDDGTADGRVSLLTRSTGGGDSSFLGTSRSGETVYVMSSGDPLVPSDGDQVADVYAVRIGGGFPEPPDPTKSQCMGDDCQGQSAAQPVPPNIGSVSFGGDGNVPLVPDPLRASVGVSKLRAVSGSAAKLKVRVPDAGRILLAGSSIRRTSVSASKAGTYSVKIALSPPARRLWRKRKRLRVSARIRFRAKDGQSASKTVKVTFKQPKGKRVKAKKGGR